MSTRSFKCATTELSVIEDAVAYHVRQALEDIRSMNQTAQSLRVLIRPSRYGDYALRGGSKAIFLPAPTSDTCVFLREAMRLTAELFESGVPYKKAGVMLSNFTPEHVTQPSLFAAQASSRLMQTVDMLNVRFGTETVQLGSRLQREKWINRREQLSPDYTTRWSDIATVTAK